MEPKPIFPAVKVLKYAFEVAIDKNDNQIFLSQVDVMEIIQSSGLVLPTDSKVRKDLCHILMELAKTYIHMTGPQPDEITSHRVLQRIETCKLKLDAAVTALKSYQFPPPALDSDWTFTLEKWLMSERARIKNGPKLSSLNKRLFPYLLDFYECAFGKRPTSTVGSSATLFLKSYVVQCQEVARQCRILPSTTENRRKLTAIFPVLSDDSYVFSVKTYLRTLKELENEKKQSLMSHEVQKALALSKGGSGFA
jgi:hypothetical protein